MLTLLDDLLIYVMALSIVMARPAMPGGVPSNSDEGSVWTVIIIICTTREAREVTDDSSNVHLIYMTVEFPI